MPYPRVCPCCDTRYPDDRSHVSVNSQQRDGRTVVRLLCILCRTEYDWDFIGGRLFVTQPPPGSTRQVPGPRLGNDATASWPA